MRLVVLFFLEVCADFNKSREYIEHINLGRALLSQISGVVIR